MNRREWITNASAGLLALASERVLASSWIDMADSALRNAQDAFDHILLGAADLDAGIRWVQERTGARATFGGVHPGAGTRNALLSLGTRHYLEIIAPDPAQPNAPDERGLRKLASPKIVQWAVHTDDIAAAKRSADAAGVKTLGPAPGSRKRPDGKMLRWQVLGVEQTTPLVPFLIQWEQGSPHPSADAPKLGSVKSLHFATPQPDALRKILRGLAIDADLRNAAEPRIVLTIQTAKGTVEIS
jgi:hypothetical protein